MTARCEKRLGSWQDRFVLLLPTIVKNVALAFRNLRPEAQAEAVQEALANACVAYARLVERGKEGLAFATVLAKYAVAQVRTGRQVGGKLNILDVSSIYCQRRKRFALQRLDRYIPEEECWREAVVEDGRMPIADLVAFRIDFPRWLQTLPPRDRRIAEALANGNRTTDVARRFQISLARVSQLRREFYKSWLAFHGEVEAEKERIDMLVAA